MRSLSIASFASLALLALAAAPGCGEAEVPAQKSLTKEEARAAGGGKADGVDFCQIYGWYSDGICDDFCARPDPDCTPASCQPVACPLYQPVCEQGYKLDDAGCPTCECNAPPPPRCNNSGYLTCALYCPFGYKSDASGCSHCSCNEPPVDPTPGPSCPGVTCELYCEHGFKTDDDGCAICSCNEPPAERTPASGQCVRNAGNSCTSDADCSTGGCGGEVCFNPAQGNPISTCDCTEPQGVSCGCVNGSCAWFE